MLTVRSGFGWSEVDKCITASKDVFNDWVRTHPHARGLRNKSFPHYDDFSTIFGKDQATGAAADFVDAVDATDFDDASNTDLDADNFEDATNTNLDGIEMFQSMPQSTYRDGMNHFTTYLRKKQEVNDKLNALPAALQELEGFTCIELVKVGAYISKEEWKVKYFFALPKESKIEFVKLQLQKISPAAYHPSFDNFP
ncbi:hypothetical protein PTKIN_Ptkin06aG0075200 [Pterospermum kingtungense]